MQNVAILLRLVLTILELALRAIERGQDVGDGDVAVALDQVQAAHEKWSSRRKGRNDG